MGAAMDWLDRVILIFVGVGVWALFGAYVLREDHAAAQRWNDVLCEAVHRVEAGCSVYGGLPPGSNSETAI